MAQGGRYPAQLFTAPRIPEMLFNSVSTFAAALLTLALPLAAQEKTAQSPVAFDSFFATEPPRPLGLPTESKPDAIGEIKARDGSRTRVAAIPKKGGLHFHYLRDGASEWKSGPGLRIDSRDILAVQSLDEWTIIAPSTDGVWQVHGFSDGDNGLELFPRAELPSGLIPIAAECLNGDLYVAARQQGSDDRNGLAWLRLRPDVTKTDWEHLPPWNGPVGELILLGRIHRSLYVFGFDPTGAPITGRFDTRRQEWGILDPHPLRPPLDHFPFPSGQDHLLVFPRSTNKEPIWTYHQITDRWVDISGELPLGPLLFASPMGSLAFRLADSDQWIEGSIRQQGTPYGWVDHGVVFAFMAAMLWVGVYLSRRENSEEDFFRGGRRVPFWASGLSLFATGASAISLMAMPGMAFATDWTYMTISFYVLVSTAVVYFVYVPLARRLNVTTSNEYLERRFGLGLRLFGSVIYSLNQVLARLAAIMLLPAIALSAIVGIPMQTSILMMGLVTTVYATMGGLEGVIWTDVIQAFVMIFSVVLCSVWALSLMSIDFGTAWETLRSAEKLNMFDPSIGLLGPTMFVLFTNAFFATLGLIGDQNFIQRVQCTSSEAEAKKAVVTQILVAVPLNLLLFLLGTILFLFYLQRPQMLTPSFQPDGVFPLFAAQNLPPGLAGLVIAALFAATMSTLSSAMNSTANLGVEDFFRRLRKTPPSDSACLWLGRWLTLVLGLVGTASALWLAQSDLRSVWDLAIMLSGLILAPISGFFLLGIFTRRAHSTGVWIGGICAIAATVLVKEFTEWHHFLYLPIGVLTCWAVGYGASLLLPGKPRDLEGLTVFTLYRKHKPGV